MELSVLIDAITNSIVNHFDFSYMITVNIATYIFIQVWDNLNGDRLLNTWQKRLMLLLAILIVSSVYVLFEYPDNIILFNSSIAAPVFWSWVLKPILTKFGIGYKKVDDYLS